MLFFKSPLIGRATMLSMVITITPSTAAKCRRRLCVDNGSCCIWNFKRCGSSNHDRLCSECEIIDSAPNIPKRDSTTSVGSENGNTAEDTLSSHGTSSMGADTSIREHLDLHWLCGNDLIINPLDAERCRKCHYPQKSQIVATGDMKACALARDVIVRERKTQVRMCNNPACLYITDKYHFPNCTELTTRCGRHGCYTQVTEPYSKRTRYWNDRVKGPIGRKMFIGKIHSFRFTGSRRPRGDNYHDAWNQRQFEKIELSSLSDDTKSSFRWICICSYHNPYKSDTCQRPADDNFFPCSGNILTDAVFIGYIEDCRLVMNKLHWKLRKYEGAEDHY